MGGRPPGRPRTAAGGQRQRRRRTARLGERTKRARARDWTGARRTHRRGGALVEVVRAHENTALGEGAGRGEGLGRDREAERQDNGGEANHLVVVEGRVVGGEGGGVEEGRKERRRMRVVGCERLQSHPRFYRPQDDIK